MEYTVFSGLVIDCRFATWPTRRSPDLVNPTTEGVVRPPSGLVITVGSPPSITATTEFVVPRSIPMILPITLAPSSGYLRNDCRLLRRLAHQLIDATQALLV